MLANIPKQNNYEVAFNNAAAILRAADVGTVCSLTGCETWEYGIHVTYFGKKYTISLPEVIFTAENIARWEQILILHYLNMSEGNEVSREPVAFADLPGGRFYASTFRQRGQRRIIDMFRHNPEQLVAAAACLGGYQSEYKDISVCIPVFPLINIIIVYYIGDDEFPADANILFPNNIINYLSIEDVAVLSDIIAGKLKKH